MGIAECHKAKNLVPDSGGKPTKVGEKVLQLQRMLPNARVIYCSATGALLLPNPCPRGPEHGSLLVDSPDRPSTGLCLDVQGSVP